MCIFKETKGEKKEENLESHVNVVFTLIGHFRIRSVYIHIYNNLSLEIPLMEGSIPLEIIHNRFISVFAMKIGATVKLLDSPLMNSNIMSNQWLSKLWYRQMTLPSQLFLVNSKTRSHSSPIVTRKYLWHIARLPSLFRSRTQKCQSCFIQIKNENVKTIHYLNPHSTTTDGDSNRDK